MNWTHLAHVDPPPPVPQTATVGPGAESVGFERSLIFYLGPNHYPAGLYLPDGYDLESRPGDDEGWTIIRARCAHSHQILTLWAVCVDEKLEGERVKVLDP